MIQIGDGISELLEEFRFSRRPLPCLSIVIFSSGVTYSETWPYFDKIEDEDRCPIPLEQIIEMERRRWIERVDKIYCSIRQYISCELCCKA